MKLNEINVLILNGNDIVYIQVRERSQMTAAVAENIQVTLLLLTFSVGDHRTSKYGRKLTDIAVK